MLTTYFTDGDKSEAVSSIKSLHPPKKYLNELVAYVMFESLEKNEVERDSASELIAAFKKEGVITGDNYMEVTN